MQDGNIHCHIDNLARRSDKGGERIAVATAAYNAGERLWSEREERYVDFGNREDVVYSRIVLPGGAPRWAADRATLWNRVDLSAQRKDARLAKSIIAAITRDIPAKLHPALLEAFVAPFVALGCVADIAIHEDGTGHNPHIHVLLSTRVLTEDGFAGKITALEQRAFVRQVRKRWADLTNTFLEKTGSALRVDHRSYKARGVGAEPTQHRGPNKFERRLKREHARRVREAVWKKGNVMAEPDASDRTKYPLLTQRQVWPPEPAASPDMTPQERYEHHRYWQERNPERPETVTVTGRDVDYDAADAELEQALAESPPTEALAEAEDRYVTPPWWQQARENARRRGEADSRTAPLKHYDDSVRERAEAMPATDREREALAAAPPSQRALVESFLMQERMRVVRDRDRAEQLRRLPPELRQKLEALWPDREDADRYPVPGPDGDLLSPRERDMAEEHMLEDLRREERDRER